MAVERFDLTFSRGLCRGSPESALCVAVQMQAVAKSFFKIPKCVDDAIDWSKNIVANRWNSQSEFADSGEFLKQCFAV